MFLDTLGAAARIQAGASICLGDLFRYGKSAVVIIGGNGFLVDHMDIRNFTFLQANSRLAVFVWKGKGRSHETFSTMGLVILQDFSKSQ